MKPLKIGPTTYESIAEAARCLGVNVKALSHRVKRHGAAKLDAHGYVRNPKGKLDADGNPTPQGVRRHLDETLKARGIAGTGSMYSVLRGLSVAQRRWLLDNTPKGAKVSDIMLAIVRDAYSEETGK